MDGFIHGNGLTRQDILRRHFEVYKRPLNEALLRQQILPMLITTNLIEQESHPTDRRKILIYPTPFKTEKFEQGLGKESDYNTPNNSDAGGGVNQEFEW